MVFVLMALGAVGVLLFLVRGANRLIVGGFALFLLAALVAENVNESVFDREELWIAIIAGVVIIGTLIRWLRLRKNEFWVMGVGLVLLVLTVIIPALSAGADLPAQLSNLPTPTPGPTQTINDRARSIFDRVVEVIAVQTGLDDRTIAQNLDDGMTVADMIDQYGGDLEMVVAQISEILSEQVQILAAQGDLTSPQAALVLSQMELIVRLGVEQDLAGSLARFEDNPLDDEE